MSEYECVDSVETLAKTLEKVKNAQKKLTALCKETGLEKDYSRTKITR